MQFGNVHQDGCVKEIGHPGLMWALISDFTIYYSPICSFLHSVTRWSSSNKYLLSTFPEQKSEQGDGFILPTNSAPNTICVGYYKERMRDSTEQRTLETHDN